MKKEELQAILNNAELSDDDKIAQIFAINGKDINKAKEASTQSQQEIEALRNQIKEKDDKLSSMQDYDDLKKYKADTIAEKEIQSRNQFLEKQGFKHPDLFASKIDWSKASIKEDGTFEGIDEDLKSLKEQYKDMFPQMQQVNKDGQASSQEVDGVTKAFMQNNPDIKI